MQNAMQIFWLGKGAEKIVPFWQTRVGVGVKKKANLYIGIVFFQWACWIILGPQKNVLHLVPSPNAIAKAFNVLH